MDEEELTIADYQKALGLVVGVLNSMPTSLGDYFEEEDHRLIRRCLGDE